MASDLDDLRDIILDKLRQVNTAVPGRIARYDPSTRKAEVEPLIQEKYADGTVLTLPRITGVPVVMPSTGTSGVVLPVANGDPCLILFAQRSIDRWLTSGGLQEAADKRMHDMSDAIAIPGLFPFSITHVDGSGVVVFNDTIKIRLDGGKIAIGTVAVELLDEITKALDDIATGLLTIPYTPTITQAASAAIKTIKGTI